MPKYKLVNQVYGSSNDDIFGWGILKVNTLVSHSNPSKQLLETYLGESPLASPKAKKVKSTEYYNLVEEWQSTYTELTLEEFIKKRESELNQESEKASVKKYTGLLTPSANKNLQKAIDLLVMGSVTNNVYYSYVGKEKQHRLSFITLTISSEEIYPYEKCYSDLLRPFLQWLTKTKKISSYVWKVELQERGQLHYHIITPNYIDCMEIRKKWNYIQREAQINLDKYNGDPNSTDIEAISEIAGITTYIAKEIMKNVQNQTALNIKLWGCTENLSKAKYFTFPLTASIIEKLLNYTNTHEVEVSYQNEWAEVYKLRYNIVKNVLTGKALGLYKNYIRELRKIIYPNGLQMLKKYNNTFDFINN